MAQEPKPTRGMPRSLLYALIPGGFLLIVVLMLVFGQAKEEQSEPPAPVESVAPASQTGSAAEKAAEVPQ